MDNYNDLAEEYEAYGKVAVTDFEIGYRHVLDLLGDIRGKKILDFGCGTGKFSRVLRDAGAEVIGVDMAEKELAIARENYPDISFCPIKLLPQDVDFDAAVLNYVITAIPLESTITLIFSTIFKHLKDGGKLVMMNSNYEKSAEREFLTFSIGKVKKEIGVPLKVYLGADKSFEIEDYYYSEAFYKEKLAEARFTVEKVIEPLATTFDFAWKDELVSPPFIIISALAKKS